MPVIHSRIRPGAYVTNGKQLFEVISSTAAGKMTLEDCGPAGGVQEVETWRVNYPPYRLVQEAPTVPNVPPAKE